MGMYIFIYIMGKQKACHRPIPNRWDAEGGRL